MSNEITTPNKTGLDALDALQANLANVRAATPEIGGKPLLRMRQEKDGWVFGQDSVALPLGTEIVFNALSIRWGYVCWTQRKGKEKNELLNERLYPISQTPPPVHELPVLKDPKYGDVAPWTEVRSVEGKILSGKFKGTEVVYKNNSGGGVQAVGRIIDAIFERISAVKGTPMAHYVMPICELQQREPYPNKSGGRTYPPDFPVVGWMDLEGNEDTDDEDDAPADVVEKLAAPEPEPVPVETPVRRRRA
jgi:hypothetical protein